MNPTKDNRYIIVTIYVHLRIYDTKIEFIDSCKTAISPTL